MSFSERINKSLHGREIGLEYASSAITGSTHNPTFLNGPEALRQAVTTDETTAGIMAPYGLSLLTTGSSAVHTLAPPIPGIEKMLYSSGGSTGYVKTRNGETIETSAASTNTTLSWTGRGLVTLVGLTTARWLAEDIPTTVSLSTST